MKIVHLSFSIKNGGAALAATRLHKSMVAHGIDSHILAYEVPAEAEADTGVVSLRSLKTRVLINLYRKLTLFLLKLYPKRKESLFSSNIWGLDLADNEVINKADIVYLHFLGDSFLSLNAVNKIRRKHKHVIWFLHDMFPITGGCHYSLSCEKYMEHCCHCPHLGGGKRIDLSYLQHELKLKLFRNSDIRVVGPSSWISDCAEKSSIFRGNKVVTISNLVDKAKFYNDYDERFGHSFGLSSVDIVILFVAHGGIDNPYKGWKYLYETMPNLEKNYKIVVAGCEKPLDRSFSDNVVFLGRFHSEDQMRKVYNLATLIVVPSLAESNCQTAVEALACGIPVVAFEVGGLVDIVDHRKNGYLARYLDSEDLWRGIDFIVNYPDKEFFRLGASLTIAGKFSEEVIIKKHKELIRSILNE